MKIKFLTLNIWNGGKLSENIIKFIAEENPDIISLQETRGPGSVTIKELLKLGYHFSEFALRAKFTDGTETGNMILSRFLITRSENIFFDVPYRVYNPEGMTDFSRVPRNMLFTEIQLDDKKINVFNIHGIWGFDGKDNDRRLKMSEIIVNNIKDKKNVILAGDFNCLPNTQTIGNIEKHLKSVFKDELKTTFNMKHKTVGEYETATVDMIFVSSDIKVLDSYSPNVDVSDHMPLVAALEV